uniref:Uncharacterized protein n=1 Tax=Lepeophtheirus salmonis TaxID=72036 RepID=A0A0K2UA16_LEPSM
MIHSKCFDIYVLKFKLWLVYFFLFLISQKLQYHDKNYKNKHIISNIPFIIIQAKTSLEINHSSSLESNMTMSSN